MRPGVDHGVPPHVIASALALALLSPVLPIVPSDEPASDAIESLPTTVDPPAPDLSIRGVVAVPDFDPGVDGPERSDARQTVMVTVANLGDARAADSRLVVTALAGGASRLVGQANLPLDPSAETTLSLPWDTRGEVGGVTLVALVVGAGDTAPANDVGATHAWVVFDSATGVDLLASPDAAHALHAVRP